MSIRKWVDDKGELNVEQSFNLPLSSLSYLKHLPTLLMYLALLITVNIAAFFVLLHIDIKLGG